MPPNSTPAPARQRLAIHSLICSSETRSPATARAKVPMCPCPPGSPPSRGASQRVRLRYGGRRCARPRHVASGTWSCRGRGCDVDLHDVDLRDHTLREGRRRASRRPPRHHRAIGKPRCIQAVKPCSSTLKFRYCCRRRNQYAASMSACGQSQYNTTRSTFGIS
jgi:hypothetical protein